MGRNSASPDLMAGVRIDRLLVERGLFESRAKARAAIEAGGVIVDGETVDRPSQIVRADGAIQATAAHPWVGRGALKLAHALTHWAISTHDRVVLDLGASTGGFAQVCLEGGARRVYAVDVGRGQLHPAVAADPRVLDLQGVDARDLDLRLVPEAPNLIVCDVSFIGLAKALPTALGLAAPGARLIALVKPQFEVGRAHVGKGGVVRDEAARQAALAGVRAFLQDAGWSVQGEIESPVLGGDGNREYLVLAQAPA
jgi:23S rRNA (cytidine1920-2'-O)/16S rRNA (cytidine1409-2'-O)-methyltransferase